MVKHNMDKAAHHNKMAKACMKAHKLHEKMGTMMAGDNDAAKAAQSELQKMADEGTPAAQVDIADIVAKTMAASQETFKGQLDAIEKANKANVEAMQKTIDALEKKLDPVVPGGRAHDPSVLYPRLSLIPPHGTEIRSATKNGTGRPPADLGMLAAEEVGI
jgi:hypothetical protein